MMNIRQYLVPMLTACMLSAGSCVKEDSRFEGVEEKPDIENAGVLSFSDLRVTLEERTEDVGSAPEARAMTRAGNTDTDTYRVTILDAAGHAVEVTDKNGIAATSFAYADRPEQIELPVGSYTLTVNSGDTPATAWEGEENTPTYGAEQTFAITKGNTTTLQAMTCRLLTVKVTVAYKETLVATMSEQTTAELVLGETNALTFEGREPALAGFLKPVAGQKNALVLYLTTTFNGKKIDRQPLTVTSNARAGEWRKITVGLQNAEDGTLIINAEIETWVNNEAVEVDTRTLAAFCEERIPDENDPDAPKLEWPGHPFDETFRLTPDLFDANGNFDAPCQFTATTQVPMTGFETAITSDNPDFAIYLQNNGLADAVDLFAVTGAAKTTLKTWGFPVSGLNTTSRTFDLSKLMETLSDYEGKHLVTMALTDEKDRKSVFALTVAVSAGDDAPRIVWVGHDLGMRYDTAELQDPGSVQVRISAPQKVKSLIVEITGALDLDGMMPAKFDLADPEAAEAGLSQKLTDLGFPVGADVSDQTQLDFDITRFMGLMGTFPGDTDFIMTVVDMAGNVTTESLKVKVS